MNSSFTISKICDIAPCFIIDSQIDIKVEQKTAVLFFHAYGGCKEEIIGLALNLAGPSHSCFVYDLPGHGENDLLFNLKNVEDFIATILKKVKDYRSVYLVGHSIGARLVLSLDAEKVVAISPPGETFFEGSQTELFKTIRVRRVKEKAPYEGLKSVLSVYQNVSPNIKNCLVLYAKDDIRSVRQAALGLKERSGTVKQIKGSNHLDIITARETIQNIKDFL